jgi:hypothetical protein
MNRASFRTLVLLAVASMAPAGIARAQGTFAVRASRAAQPNVMPGRVFTAPFTLTNSGAAAAAPRATVALPQGWSTLTNAVPATIDAGASDLWLVSITAPSNARAGVYVIRADVTNGDRVTSDSIAVTIAEHRALDVRMQPGLGYVTAGDSYEAQFTVRNAGNIESTVSLKATASRGQRCVLDRSEVTLAPGASVVVTARIRTGAVGRSADDIVEVVATDVADRDVRDEASLSTTIIPKGGKSGGDYWTFPGTVALRAAGSGAGVSPFVATGSGRLSQSASTTIDFAIRSRTGPQSAFGERDEYRVALRSDRGAIMLGDQPFGYTRLTSSGSLGFGGELRATLGDFVAGAYAQHNRWTPSSPVEAGVQFGTAPTNPTSMSVVLLNRQQSGAATRLAATTGRSSIGDTDLEFEVAASDSAGARGLAHRERVSGVMGDLSYDLVSSIGGASFGGVQRAAADQNLSLSLKPVSAVLLTSSTNVHTALRTPSNAFGQRTITSNLSASLNSGSSLDYDLTTRDDQGAPGGVRGAQHSVRMRAHVAAGPFDLVANVQNGIVRSNDTLAAKTFLSFGGSLRTDLGRDQYLSFFGDVTDGRTLGSSGKGTMSGGLNAQLLMPLGFRIMGNGTVNAPRNDTERWLGQADVRLERQVQEATLSLRAHFSKVPGSVGTAGNGYFFEIRRPLRIPTARLDVGNEARGEVVDAATGKPVAGVLVRLGEFASVTDSKGQVRFQGIGVGEYRASVEGSAAVGSLVTGGEKIHIAEGSRATRFTLSLTQGARVVARVRRFESAPGAVRVEGDSAVRVDSLVDAGAVFNVAVALISARDTIWQAADDMGRLDFGSVAPGRYTMAVLSADVPEFHAFQQREIDVMVGAGERRDVELRLVPRKRAVQVIGSETVIKVEKKIEKK